MLLVVDTLGLTFVEIIDPPVLWEDVDTPVTARVIVSCTMDDCTPFDTLPASGASILVFTKMSFIVIWIL